MPVSKTHARLFVSSPSSHSGSLRIQACGAKNNVLPSKSLIVSGKTPGVGELVCGECCGQFGIDSRGLQERNGDFEIALVLVHAFDITGCALFLGERRRRSG